MKAFAAETFKAHMTADADPEAALEAARELGETHVTLRVYMRLVGWLVVATVAGFGAVAAILWRVLEKLAEVTAVLRAID